MKKSSDGEDSNILVYAMKRKQLLSLLLTLLICMALLSGCLGTKEIKTVSVPLNTLGFTPDDIPSDYEKKDEEYITHPYIEKGSFLDGYKILEKYRVIYMKDNITYIFLLLARLESCEKTRSAIHFLKEVMTPFNEIEIEKIGDESCFYKMSIGELTKYSITFTIADVIASIGVSNLSQELILKYAYIIEGNIKANL